MILNHPWLGALFGDPEMSALWSAERQLDHYLAFETALALALETTGRVLSPQGQLAADVIESADIDIASLAKSTQRDGLPIPDFVKQLRTQSGVNAGAVHTGATSQDVMDTALALTLKDVSNLVVTKVTALDAALANLVAQHGDAHLMGRTRMQAALPITVADRVQAWRKPLQDHVAGLEILRTRVERLQLGGAVGTRLGFGKDGDAIAAHMADALGLADGPVWHTDRTGLAEYGSRLSLITGSLGKLGQDVALMAQQGVDEITLKGGGGSSAMPHKSNPVDAELLVTIARFNATQVAGLHHAVIHEQERSGAAWMLEWMILPQMAIAAGRALNAAQDICSRIQAIGGS